MVIQREHHQKQTKKFEDDLRIQLQVNEAGRVESKQREQRFPRQMDELQKVINTMADAQEKGQGDPNHHHRRREQRVLTAKNLI